LSPPVLVSGLNGTRPNGVAAPGKVLPAPYLMLVLAPASGLTLSICQINAGTPAGCPQKFCATDPANGW
jgi:hypothetical protein